LTDPTYASILSAPGFSIGIECNADEITGIDYLEPQPEVAPKTPLAQEAVRQLRAWLADPAFEFGLPLAPAGTHFQRRVWARIAAIPSGQTLSYGEVAAAIGSGPRAVGNACGANPYTIVVPCHRVIGVGQAIGHYSGGDGVATKRWLIAHEQASS